MLTKHIYSVPNRKQLSVEGVHKCNHPSWVPLQCCFNLQRGGKVFFCCVLFPTMLGWLLSFATRWGTRAEERLLLNGLVTACKEANVFTRRPFLFPDPSTSFATALELVPLVTMSWHVPLGIHIQFPHVIPQDILYHGTIPKNNSNNSPWRWGNRSTSTKKFYHLCTWEQFVSWGKVWSHSVETKQISL